MKRMKYTISGLPVFFFSMLSLLYVSQVKARIHNEVYLFQQAVTGTVTDSSGKPLGGVSVQIKETGKGTFTNQNGDFTINANSSDVLVISYVGYIAQQIPVNGQNSISVKLLPQQTSLNDVVVIGYGTQKKGDLTSAISTVNVKDLSSRPVVSAQEALVGKAAGVQVSIPSGEPGSDLSIRVRGVGSPNGGEPLYVVDGVVLNDIKSLDPNSIASISILKDASASGIYGAAGSTNGVVMITTKQGANGKAKVEGNFYAGMQQAAKKLGVLNNQQWLALQTDIAGGQAPSIPSYYNLQTTNNNWQDLIFHTASQTSANVALSGGNETGNYYFGVGYLNQQGIVVGSNFQKYSTKFSINQNPTTWLNLGANINYNRTNQRTIPQNASSANGGAITSALVTPEYVPIKMPANSPTPNVYGYSTFYSGDNPLSDIYNNTNSTIGNNLLGDAHLEIKLPFDLKYRSQFNVSLENANYQYFLDPYNNLYGITLNGQGKQNYSEVFRWTWDNTLTYDHKFGLHSLNVVVGTSSLQEKIFLSAQSGTNFASNGVQTLNGASSQLTIGTDRYTWTTNSYFGRLMYNYADKYLLTATLRADGTSRVGINNKWGAFPAVSAGWRVSNEDFMKDVHWIQDFKIRAGWGETGNLPPYTMLYPTYTLYSVGNAYSYSSDGSSPGVAVGSQLGNPALKWESGQQTNVGFDASFVNYRLTVSADYYHKKVNNMIFTQQLPLDLGGLTEAINLPGYDINNGFEFTADAKIVRQKDFEWSMNLNMSFNNNKISGLDSSTAYQTGGITIGGSKEPIYTGRIANGYSLGEFWGYKAEGVDPQTGIMKYSPDQMALGNALPKITYGIAEDFRYKAISLSLLFDGVGGNKIYNATRMEMEALSGYQNESTEVLKRWEKPGDITNVPGAVNGIGAQSNMQTYVSSYFVESGSFFRLRSATLGYQFNSEALKRISIQALRLYVSAQNIFMITKYKGYTPDVNSFGTGTNNSAVNANAGSASLMSLGIDDGTYPAARTYTVGLNIQF